MKAVPPRTHVELVDGWDRLAVERHRQIVSGEDISFHHVIVPTALSLLEGCEKNIVIELGSGTGQFTELLTTLAGNVLAVDPSKVSVSLAKEACSGIENVTLFECSIECAVDQLTNFNVTSAIAVMSLMTAPDLPAVAQSLSIVLPPGGRFVAIMTHPWFWPQYWGYHDKKWFSYEKELFVEAPFKISKRSTEILTTHIHRPLEQYLSPFSEYGFYLETLIEPVPGAEVQEMYSKPWRFPRFIGLKWARSR